MLKVNNTATISCPTGQSIQILCAFYGIDPNLRCPNVTYTNSTPTSCYSQASKQRILTNCNGKSSCSFANSSGLIDSCDSLTNMLYIQWQCVSLGLTTVTSTTPGAPSCPQTYILPFGECSTSLVPYTPQFLLNSSDTYFEYPIYEQIACQNSKLLIACSPNLVIHIYAAYFGIQSATSTSWCMNTTSLELPEMCFSQSSFDIINATCEYKSSCYLRATTTQIGAGDLCPSYSKQLFVQYQCVDPNVLASGINQCPVNNTIGFSLCPSSNSSTVRENMWCTGSMMTMNCDAGSTINIMCAFYGIHPYFYDQCNFRNMLQRPVCYFNQNPRTVLANACNGRSSCNETSVVFTDPCNGLDKLLYVQWQCVWKLQKKQ